MNLFFVRSRYLRLLQCPRVNGSVSRLLDERERVSSFLSLPMDGGTFVKLVLSSLKVLNSTRDHNCNANNEMMRSVFLYVIVTLPVVVLVSHQFEGCSVTGLILLVHTALSFLPLMEILDLKKNDSKIRFVLQ